MLRHVSDNSDVIDIGPRKSRRWRIAILVFLAIALLTMSRLLSVYLSALWFESLGYSAVYWYIFKLKAGLFVGAAVITALILSSTFWLFQRLFGSAAFEQRTIILNNQPFQLSPAKVVRPLGWLVSAFVGLIYGLALKDDWQQFALFTHQPAASEIDPSSVSHLASTCSVFPGMNRLAPGCLVSRQ